MASIDAALEIIQSVRGTAENVCVNKAQCKRVAERFGVIGKALEDLKTSEKNVDSTFLEPIVAVLEKGKSLVESYEDEHNAIKNVLYRAENCAAFREVHEEIDSLGTSLNLDRADKGELKTSQTEKNMLLNSDAMIDREEMLPNVQRVVPKRGGSSVERAEGDVTNMEEAVTDKCFNAESNAEDLSYLNIPFAAIVLKGAIKELKPLEQRPSKEDAHLDGLALVEKGTWNGCDCAVKVFKSGESNWNEQELHKEIASLVKLRHPHVTQLIGCSQDKGNTYVLYEMMDSDLRVLIESRKKRTALSNLLQENRPFSRAREVSIITQIARGMFYLHEKGLVHGELKCTNLLVKQLGDHIDVKVADFHCSRELGKAPLPGAVMYKPAHRARWMPPEDFPYCSGVDHPDLEHPTDDLLMKGDVYSFAMTCYEVVTGKYPFDGERSDAIKEKVKGGFRPKLPEALSLDLKSLIAKCWHQDPNERPSFQDICYVLKVEAVNLSQVQKLLDRFRFGVANDRVAAAPTSQDWSEALNGGSIPRPIPNDDIGVAQDLPHYLNIKPSDLKRLGPLGTGSSAEVFEASWIGCRFAVKWLRVEHVAKLRHEVSIMMKLLHPHVIRLVGFSVLFNRCAIVMELLDTSLRNLMDERIRAARDPRHATPFSEAEALAIIRKLALGMAFMHSRGVTHGDLKPGNVLVRRNEHLKTGMDVKIVDFGLSQWLGESAPERVSVVGRYRAPEIILSMEPKAKHVDIDPKAADVYSFAMVCYEVITGKEPFYGRSSDYAANVAKGGGTPKLGTHMQVRKDLWGLLQKCWSWPDRQERPTFDEIVKTLDGMCRR